MTSTTQTSTPQDSLGLAEHPLLAAIGGTALVELTRVGTVPTGIRVFAKTEFMNPGGSIKDRAAAAMVLDGLQRGLLRRPGNGIPLRDVPTIIDATSGNTGIAFAMIGASLGIPVTLVMPENTSPERKQTMRCLGATVIDTVPAEDGSDGAFEHVRELVSAEPDRYFYPNQYDNPVNARAHELGTGAEIWRQTGGAVTHFVASMGTSGTLMGTSRRLKAENPAVQAVAVQPDSPLHGIEGTKHMASTIRPSILDESLIDEVVTVTTARAYEVTRALALREGLFCGISSGANVAAALDLAHRGRTRDRDRHRPARHRFAIPQRSLLGATMITITDDLLARIHDQCRSAYPEEGCGALLGSFPQGDGARTVVDIVAIVSSREAEEQYHRFRIDPLDYQRTDEDAARRGLDVVGFYHSHPDHPAVPSDYDRDHAFPGLSYIVVATAGGRAGQGEGAVDVPRSTSWELTPDRSTMTQEAEFSTNI